MKMTEGEIIRDYAEAKDKNKQIGILADMNLVTKKEMASWLADRGQQVDKRLLAAGPAKKPVKAEPQEYIEIPDGTEDEPAAITFSGEPIEVAMPHAPADQTAKADAGKLRLSLVPMQIMFDIAEVREFGNRKYGDPDNWRNVEPDRYVDALLRHTLRFVQDRNAVDAESGLTHLKHMACNVAFLCEMLREESECKED